MMIRSPVPIEDRLDVIERAERDESSTGGVDARAFKGRAL
jgi:hypothetical protein